MLVQLLEPVVFQGITHAAGTGLHVPPHVGEAYIARGVAAAASLPKTIETASVSHAERRLPIRKRKHVI